MHASDTGPLHEFVCALVEAQTARAVLDLGCGRGDDLMALAARAPASARLAGLDIATDAIAAARAAAGPDPRIEFIVHDARTTLPYADGTFDRVLSVNLLECIADSPALLREIHRVLAPGGTVVCAHWDWDSVLVDHEDRALVRKLVHAFTDWRQTWMAEADGWMGRRLWGTFRRSGLFDGTVQAFPYTSTTFEPGTYGWEHIHGMAALARHGVVAPDEYDRFLAGVEDQARAGTYFFSVTLCAFVGRAT